MKKMLPWHLKISYILKTWEFVFYFNSMWYQDMFLLFKLKFRSQKKQTKNKNSGSLLIRQSISYISFDIFVSQHSNSISGYGRPLKSVRRCLGPFCCQSMRYKLLTAFPEKSCIKHFTNWGLTWCSMLIGLSK